MPDQRPDIDLSRQPPRGCRRRRLRSGPPSNDEVPSKQPPDGGSSHDEGPGPSQRKEQKESEGKPVA